MTAPQTPDLREALADLIAAFDVDDDLRVTVKPDRMLSVALLSAQGALDEAPSCASDDRIATLEARIKQVEAERDEAPVYGIIDPDYARVFTIARCLAWSEGYALLMHGSFTRDLDLLAVPWAETVCEPEHLVRRVEEAAGLKLVSAEPGQKPHGRLAWTMMFSGFSDPRFIDLSVMPRPKDDAATARADALERAVTGLGEALKRIAEASPEPDDKEWYDVWNDPAVYRWVGSDGAVHEGSVDLGNSGDVASFSYERGLHAAAVIARAALAQQERADV